MSVRLKYIFRRLQMNDFSSALRDLRNINVLGTNRSAYRKIHSLITSVIDKIIGLRPENVNQDVLINITAEISKTALLIQYQKERKLIRHELADDLYSILLELVGEMQRYMSSLQEGNNIARHEILRKIQSMARAIKIIIDGIVALNYNKLSKR